MKLEEFGTDSISLQKAALPFYRGSNDMNTQLESGRLFLF